MLINTVLRQMISGVISQPRNTVSKQIHTRHRYYTVITVCYYAIWQHSTYTQTTDNIQ